MKYFILFSIFISSLSLNAFSQGDVSKARWVSSGGGYSGRSTGMGGGRAGGGMPGGMGGGRRGGGRRGGGMSGGMRGERSGGEMASHGEPGDRNSLFTKVSFKQKFILSVN